MTQDQLRRLRLKGNSDVVDFDAVQPPKLEIDPRFAQAFPAQAEMIRQYGEAMQTWWRNTSIKRTGE